MRTIIRLTLATATLVAAVPNVFGQTSLHVTSVETAQLPRFCWSQLEVPNAKGDDFRISGCGPAANHYCSALIYMIRARGHVTKQSRLDLLGHADADVKYTEKSIADYPKCPIREHVAGTRVELDNLMRMYGYKRPKAQ